MASALLLLLAAAAARAQACYWNAECPYQLYASRTPYDSVRGDVRDYPALPDCEAVSVWVLSRHGNRNPGSSVTDGMSVLVPLKDAIIGSYEAGSSQLCAQDIDMFRKWTWNETLEVSESFLTGVGYEELYELGQRIRQKYSHLLQGSAEEFYFRPTNEQRTVTSSIAFIHGLTEGLNINVTHEDPRAADDVIRPYENCDKYHEEVRGGAALQDELDAYFASAQYVAVRNAVQQRLGVSTILSADDVMTLYELCRFYRSWTETLQAPWCAAFSHKDLLVMEYYDDVRHYYRNGYGSWINVNLGMFPLKDLYENFEAVVQGSGRKVSGYFSHDTMMEMVYSALGLYKDDTPLQGSYSSPSRMWRSSFIGAFTTNIIAVLNRCSADSSSESYRVQLFINEQETAVCPVSGCTWEEFRDKFLPYTTSTLDICSLDYESVPVESPVLSNSAAALKPFWSYS